MTRVTHLLTLGRRMAAAATMVAAGLQTAVAAAPPPPRDSLGTIVVTGKKLSDPVADAALTRRVEAALQADPYFYSDHVSVETVNGIVHLRGFVYDDWDLRIASRLARRSAAGRRVVVELEIVSNGSD